MCLFTLVWRCTEVVEWVECQGHKGQFETAIIFLREIGSYLRDNQMHKYKLNLQEYCDRKGEEREAIPLCCSVAFQMCMYNAAACSL